MSVFYSVLVESNKTNLQKAPRPKQGKLTQLPWERSQESTPARNLLQMASPSTSSARENGARNNGPGEGAPRAVLLTPNISGELPATEGRMARIAFHGGPHLCGTRKPRSSRKKGEWRGGLSPWQAWRSLTRPASGEDFLPPRSKSWITPN